ncbi:MAG: hypothetical protein MUE40_03450 [Anaerolineae bacterium]|jgi:hypothetical protein|nr:hypothetical protein [Anaerolineae bacterium]
MFDAPGWFRVKIPRYGLRVVFRLLLVAGEPAAIFEVAPAEAIPAVTEKYLEIMQISFRKDACGAELRRRYLTHRRPPAAG